LLEGMTFRPVEIGNWKMLLSGNECAKTKVMKISKEPSPMQIEVDQKQPENVEYFSYLDSVVTNDVRCTPEIKSKITVAKAAFNETMALFTSKLDLNLRKELVKGQFQK